MKAKLTGEVLDYLAPFLVRAGRYAYEVQARVEHKPPKQGTSDPFSEALTDADLSIQAFIEVALLARFPEISFFGEECAHSLNMKYFPAEADLRVYLDPVDGTRFFRDNLPRFNVIATIADQDRVWGAACFVPRADKFFRAERGKGVTIQSSAQVLSGNGFERLDLSGNAEWIVTWEMPVVKQHLGKDFGVTDVNCDYTPETGCLCLNSILLGECSALIGRSGSIIDCGAIAFIAGEAGAVVSDFRGNDLPPPSQLVGLRYPEFVVCKDQEVWRRVQDALKDEVNSESVAVSPYGQVCKRRQTAGG
ncbi:MAG: hypothetical protein GX589_01385 [Deltaproteobacteria bacterium]|nr:hypothetical protein [Deltaproteobacteria bacterium]